MIFALLIKFLLFCVTFVAFVACTTETGVIITLGDEALQTGWFIDLPGVITSALTNTTLPDIDGSKDFIIARIDYNVTSLQLLDFNIGEIEVQYIDEGFEMSLSSIVVNATFDWSYVEHTAIIITVKDHGTGSMSFSEGTYDIKVKIQNQNGSPYFDITRNKLSLNRVDLHLDGGADWFYELFNFLITPVVKKTIDEIAEDAVATAVNLVNSKIQTIPVNLPLVDGIAFSWGLTSDFDTSSNNGFGSFYSSGYFLPLNDITALPPFPAPDLPSSLNEETIQCFVSEYTFNSLGWALLEAGAFNISIPLGTTNDWRVLIPSLYRSYPDEDIEATIGTTVYPGFFLSTDGLSIKAAPYMKWNIKDNSTIVNAFTLLIEFEATVDLYFNNSAQVLQGSVGVPTFTMSLYSTNIGNFSLFPLETAINTAIYAIILPSINNVLGNGIPIPSLFGVSLKDPVLDFQDGFLLLSSDFQVAPPYIYSN